MKKSFLLLALSALMLPAFVACNKDDSTTEEVKFEAPKYQKAAQKITLQGSDIKSIEFTESGRYIVERAIVLTKAEEETEFITGTFTFDGKTYKLDGFGEVEVSGSGRNVTVTVTEASGETTTVTGSSEAPTSTDPAYRTWKIENVKFKVTGGDLSSAGVTYTSSKGADLNDIADYLNKNGVKFNADEYEGYNIQYITISGCGGFIIDFTGEPSYIGESEIKGNSFEYDLEIGGSELINAEGNGTIEFKNGRLVLTLKGEINGNSKSYDYSVEFRLLEV